jgi:hypothetical protein
MSQHGGKPTQRKYLQEVWEDRSYGGLIRPIISSVNLQSKVFIIIIIIGSSKVRFVLRRVAQTRAAEAINMQRAQFTLAWTNVTGNEPHSRPARYLHLECLKRLTELNFTWVQAEQN